MEFHCFILAFLVKIQIIYNIVNAKKKKKKVITLDKQKSKFNWLAYKIYIYLNY